MIEALVILASIAPGGTITDGSAGVCVFDRPIVARHGHALRAHWQPQNLRYVWRTGHGLVTFNGAELANRSSVTVTVTVRCT